MAGQKKINDKNGQRQDKKSNKSDGKKNRNLFIVKIILISIFVAGVSMLFFNIYSSAQSRMPNVIKELPLISAQSYSSADGDVHNVRTNVSFSLDKKFDKNFDEARMQEITVKTIESADYERLKEPDGTTYLKKEIQKNVELHEPNLINENFDVYISGYDLGTIPGSIDGLIIEKKNDGKNRDEQILEMFGK